ncbi:MAG: hypothetical protein AAB401_12145 [Acidobacteriota bacterium]
MKCPPLNNLLDHARNLLAEAESATVKTHLQSGCRSCEENLRWLTEASQLMAQDRSFEFSEDTIKGLVAWFKSQPAHARPSVRKLLANLIFDSLAARQVAFVRTEAVAGQSPAGRQMLFQAEGYDIDLRFEGVEDKAAEDLIGQVLPQSDSATATGGATVELWQDEKQQLSAEANEHGVFRFARIPSGVYDLKIQIAEDEINIVRVATARTI